MSALTGVGGGAAVFLPGTHIAAECAWVYLLIGENDDGGFMKIGCSVHPLRRWKELARSPVSDKYMPDVKYAAIWHAKSQKQSYRVERLLHHRFRDRRIEGEWFRFDFKNADDKRDFNEGCKKILDGGWWEKFSFSVVRELC